MIQSWMVKISKGVAWFASRMLLGLLSVILFLPMTCMPVYVDGSERTLATVGKTTYYGFPAPVRSMAVGGSSLDWLLFGSVVDIAFWTAVVAFCDLFFFQGKSRRELTVRRFLANWASVFLGVMGIAGLAAGIVWLIEIIGVV